jgi:hypothetical protein
LGFGGGFTAPGWSGLIPADCGGGVKGLNCGGLLVCGELYLLVIRGTAVCTGEVYVGEARLSSTSGLFLSLVF